VTNGVKLSLTRTKLFHLPQKSFTEVFIFFPVKLVHKVLFHNNEENIVNSKTVLTCYSSRFLLASFAMKPAASVTIIKMKMVFMDHPRMNKTCSQKVSRPVQFTCLKRRLDNC
jgi:hypothetical protein